MSVVYLDYVKEMGNIFCSWNEIIHEHIVETSKLMRISNRGIQRNKRIIERLKNETGLLNDQAIIFNEKRILLYTRQNELFQNEILELTAFSYKLESLYMSVAKAEHLEYLEQDLAKITKRYENAKQITASIEMSLDSAKEIGEDLSMSESVGVNMLNSDVSDEELLSMYRARQIPMAPSGAFKQSNAYEVMTVTQRTDNE